MVALMAGNAITRLTADKDYCDEDTNSTSVMINNNTDPCFLTRCETDRVDIAISLSLLVGIMMVSHVWSGGLPECCMASAGRCMLHVWDRHILNQALQCLLCSCVYYVYMCYCVLHVCGVMLLCVHVSVYVTMYYMGVEVCNYVLHVCQCTLVHICTTCVSVYVTMYYMCVSVCCMCVHMFVVTVYTLVSGSVNSVPTLLELILWVILGWPNPMAGQSICA